VRQPTSQVALLVWRALYWLYSAHVASPQLHEEDREVARGTLAACWRDRVDVQAQGCDGKRGGRRCPKAKCV
jgi:hypothetical protein